ncbi:MAG TPA: hypothetical protein VF091_04745 [Gaiellaceae bacterium]
MYGFRKPSASQSRPSLRTTVWICVSILVLAVGGFAYTQMPHDRNGAARSSAPTPAVVYGQLGTFSGEPGACTEYELLATGGWRCDTFQLQMGPMRDYTRFAAAVPYDGPCAHLMADQTSGRWVCVEAHLPQEPTGVNG